MGSYPGGFLEIRIKDKITNENLIGINRLYHPDSVRISRLLGNNVSTFGTSDFVISPKNTPEDYFLYAFLEGNEKFVIKYSSIEKDTLDVFMNVQLRCDLQKIYKIYNRNQLIFQTFGDKLLNDALFLDIKK